MWGAAERWFVSALSRPDYALVCTSSLHTDRNHVYRKHVVAVYLENVLVENEVLL